MRYLPNMTMDSLCLDRPSEAPLIATARTWTALVFSQYDGHVNVGIKMQEHGALDSFPHVCSIHPHFEFTKDTYP